jgi:hypothetical protein
MMFGISPDEPDLVHALHLPIGERVTVRRARPQDSGMIQAYMRSLSPASRRNRFLGALNEVSANELYGMTHTDRCSHPALIAENVVEGACTMIGERAMRWRPMDSTANSRSRWRRAGDAKRWARCRSELSYTGPRLSGFVISSVMSSARTKK